MVHLRQPLTAAGIALDRMMDDWGEPGHAGGKVPEVLIAMRRTQAELDRHLPRRPASACPEPGEGAAGVIHPGISARTPTSPARLE